MASLTSLFEDIFIIIIGVKPLTRADRAIAEVVTPSVEVEYMEICLSKNNSSSNKN